MIEFIRASVRLLLCIFASLFYLILILLLFVLGFRLKYRFRLVKQWARTINRILGIKVSVNKADIPQGVFVLPNHRSWIDIPLILSIIPAVIISKKEISYWPVIGWGFFAIDAIMVDRSKMGSLIKTYKEIKKRILQHKTVILFPEGTICRGPLTGKFKNGAFKLAAEQQIEIVPVAFEFEDRRAVWATDEIFLSHYYKTMGKPKTNIDVKIGNVLKSEDAEWLSMSTKKLDGRTNNVYEKDLGSKNNELNNKLK